MALRVWLPLNGTLENKGISDTTVTNYGATIDNNGKIGKCYKNTGTTYCTASVDIKVNSPFSLCFWYRIDTWVSWGTAITLNTSGKEDYIGMCPHSNGTQIGTNWYEIRNGTSTAIFDSYHSNTITVGTWNHIAITFDGSTKIKTYINGILVSDGTVRTTPLTNFNQLTLFKRSTTSTYGKNSLNDVRVYDHCLSAKEVKEISQGLVLHYKLDGSNQVFNGARNYLGNSRPYYTGYDFNDTNKLLRRNYNRNSSSGNPPFDQTYDACSDIVYENGDQFRRIIISSDRDNTITNNYQVMHPWIYSGLEKYTNNGSFWSQIQVGDKISFSCSVKSNNYFLLKSVLRIFTSSSNYAYHFFPDGIIYGVDVGNLNTWYKLSSTLTVTQELYDLISNWDEMTRFMLIMQFSQAPNVSIANENIVIDFKEYMLEFSDTPHDWVPAPEDFNIDETKIIDSSGYGNDGTIVGTLTIQQDTERYGVSTAFAASSAVNCGRGAMVTDSITVNLWSKYSTYSNLVSCTQGGGWNFENNSGLTFPVYISNVGYVHINAASRPAVANYANSWHMFTGTYDRLKQLTSLYIDGKLIGTGSVSAPNQIQYHSSNVIWINAEATDSSETASYGNAKSFSDFRIYATALSAEDILDLYHTSMNIDDMNVLHSFELAEQSGNMFAGSPMTGTVTWDDTNNYYTITSNPSTSTWGIGPAVGTLPKKIIPWGMSYILTYEVYSPTAAQWYIDYNNNDPTVSLSGNDNDNGRLRTGVNVPANTWTLITYGCSNTNETKNPDHLPLYDYSTGLGPVMSNMSSAITWHMRNPQWYLVDADNKEHIYESGVFQANFLKEDSQSSYTSFRNEEKAVWAHEFVEK